MWKESRGVNLLEKIGPLGGVLVKHVGCGEWFGEGIVRQVGDGKSTRFWEDVWVSSGIKLREVFPRLYSLEESKN